MSIELPHDLAAVDVATTASVVESNARGSQVAHVMGENGLYAVVGVTKWFDLEPTDPETAELLSGERPRKTNDADSWSD